MIVLLAACETAATTGEIYSFDNCEATVDADVPAFYATYFLCTDIVMDGGSVVLSTESLPPYTTWYYGEDHANYAEWDDRGGAYQPNPNTLVAQNIAIRVAASPVERTTITDELVDLEAGTSEYEYPGGAVGIAPDSVANFNATAAPGDDILDEQWTFDEWGAHPAQRGEYHHHMANAGTVSALEHAGVAEVEVYGIMCDGTVLLGCTELDGTDVTGALDAQNGHVGDLVDTDGTTHFTARYHTHLCEELGHYGLAPEIQFYETCDRSQ